METELLSRLQARSDRNKPSEHPAWGADVERVFHIFRQAERGNLAVLYRLYDDLYDRDATLQNQVNVRRDAIASLPVDIQSGDPDDTAANDLADRFRRVWSRLDWESLLRHHQFSSSFYGLAGTEISWDRGPDGTWDPVELHHVRSHAFKTAAEHNAEGHLAGALLVRTECGYEPLMPDRWIITEWDELRATASNGLMRASSVFSVLKSAGIGNWVRLVQRHGLPFLLAEIDDWSDEFTKQVLRSALARIGEIPGILVPKNAKTELKPVQLPPISSAAHAELVKYLDNALAKLWNGAQLITETGGSAGNYTVANNHRDARYALLAADKRRLERSVRTQVVLPWMRINSFRGVAAPRIDIGLAELDYATALIAQAKVLNEMGIKSDPAQLLALAGLRPAKEAS